MMTDYEWECYCSARDARWLDEQHRKAQEEAETCAKCGGEGVQRIGGYDADNPPDEIDCDACGGTGRIVAALERDAFDGIEEA